MIKKKVATPAACQQSVGDKSGCQDLSWEVNPKPLCLAALPSMLMQAYRTAGAAAT